MSAALFGVAIDGIKRDAEWELFLGISWGQPIGGCPVAVPYAPGNGSRDRLDGKFTAWAQDVTAASLEGAAQPHGEGSSTMILPVISGSLAVPGIVGTVSGGFCTIANVLVQPQGFQSRGRVAQGVPYIEYEVTCRIPCDQTNETFSAIAPDFVRRKFGTHSWGDDQSVQIEGTTQTGYAQGLARQHGREPVSSITLDHLTIEEADALIKWARIVRGDAVAIDPYSYGPSYAGEAITVVLTKLSLKHVNGNFWEATLETALADYTATKPTIWSITPAYIVSGAAANVVVRGSGFDASTAVTVGGVAATVTSWTSGTLAVTVPAGVAGQYEVIATNAQGSGTGTLWRYDAGEITFGTGGSIVATTAVAIAANQLVGINASGDAVLADAVLGIVAVGYAATTVAAGGALQINQTGHATPVSGLTDGAQAFLGNAGGYASAPPSGATISQQVGIATATGVAVNCGDGATYL